MVFTGQEIRDGQNVWQSIGGQEVGSIWGHGAYVAPDWSADWLHRESVWLLNTWATNEHGSTFDELDATQQAILKAHLKEDLRTNTYDKSTGDLVISPDRARAIAAVAQHYTSLFGEDPELDDLREAYAIPKNSIKSPERQRLMNSFFFWASWACVTQRPDSTVSYTNNWPPEGLVENRPTAPIIIWSVISFVMLLAGIAAGILFRCPETKWCRSPRTAR